MCEENYRHDNWFLPHPSATYNWITSSNELPNPAANLPPHTSLSSLFIEHIFCLHLVTHPRAPLLLPLSHLHHFLSLHHRHRQTLPSTAPAGPFPLIHARPPVTLHLLVVLVPLLLLHLLLLLLLPLSPALPLLLRHPPHRLPGRLDSPQRGVRPLLLSFTFITLFSSQFFLLAIKQYALLMMRSLPISLPSLLSSPLFSRLYLFLLVFFAFVFSVTFLFIVLALTTSSPPPARPPSSSQPCRSASSHSR